MPFSTHRRKEIRAETAQTPAGLNVIGAHWQRAFLTGDQGTAPSPDPHMVVRIEGTTGIVTFDVGGQRSIDVFYYAGGRWHAWYSQHTNENAG